VICPDPVEDQEAEASAEAARAAVEADLAEASAEAAHAEAEALEADSEVTTDRRITDRPIFTARILAGDGTDRAITAAVAEAVSVRF
jgi:hypothetical protein